jgi:hypothetical protein
MKIWLDDLRDPKDFGREDCVWVKTAMKAVELFIFGRMTYISFDHDLGNDEAGTGYDVAKIIELCCCDYPIEFSCPEWEVHSANPVGRKAIESAMQRAGKTF